MRVCIFGGQGYRLHRSAVCWRYGIWQHFYGIAITRRKDGGCLKSVGVGVLSEAIGNELSCLLLPRYLPVLYRPHRAEG